jgi:hypothetical protein
MNKKGRIFMKKMSKYFSLAVAAVMAFCLCSFGVIFEASADDTYNITINKPLTDNNGYSFEDHTFTAYKVFAASIDTSSDAYTYALDDYCLDKGGYGTYTTASITGDSAAREFAEYLNTHYFSAAKDKTVNADVYSVSQAGAAADTSIEITVAQSGYYLIVDSYSGNSTAMSLVMLGTAGASSGTINVKADAATQFSEKLVKDDTDWSKKTDSQTDEEIEFRLEIKTPDGSIKNYNHDYIYKIEDTLDTSLAYVAGSAKVCSDAACSTAVADVLDADSTKQTGTKLEIVFNDLRTLYSSSKLLANQTYYIYYKAKFTGANAKYAFNLGTTDVNNYNKNAAKLTYSNKPYEVSTLSTAEQSAYVWTYGFSFRKVKSDDVSVGLKGAVFNIYKSTKDASNLLKFSKNASGEYYIDSNGSADIAVSETDATLGQFKVYGFDDNTDYILVEKEAPSGFTLASDTVFRASAEYAAATGLLANTGLAKSIKGNYVVPSDVLSGEYKNTDEKTVLDDVTNPARIWNAAGSQLIGTGGIGTTIFYVAGGILMVGAAILLLTKLRMRNKD